MECKAGCLHSQAPLTYYLSIGSPFGWFGPVNARGDATKTRVAFVGGKDGQKVLETTPAARASWGVYC